MELTIVLQKEVESVEAGQVIADIVKARLADRPDVTITATINQKLLE